MRDVVRHAHVVQSTIQRRGACSSKILHPMIGCHLEHTRGQDMVLYIQHKVQHTLSAVASRCFSLNYSVLRFWLSAKSRENQVLAQARPIDELRLPSCCAVIPPKVYSLLVFKWPVFNFSHVPWPSTICCFVVHFETGTVQSQTIKQSAFHSVSCSIYRRFVLDPSHDLMTCFMGRAPNSVARNS